MQIEPRKQTPPHNQIPLNKANQNFVPQLSINEASLLSKNSNQAIFPQNIADSQYQQIDINDIDPNKQLFIPNQTELKRLMSKGIIVEKLNKKTGQKNYDIDVEELRKQQRRQKNRASASESRRRQRDYIKLLEDKVNHLEKENFILREKLGFSIDEKVDSEKKPVLIGNVENKVGNKRKSSDSDIKIANGQKMGNYIQLPMEMINKARGANGQVTLLLTCLACCMCLMTPAPTLFNSKINKISHVSNPESYNSHSILKRSLDNSYNNVFGSKSSYNSRNLFEFSPGLDFTPDLETLLSSPMVQEELESRIRDGKICTFMFENFSSKMRLFQKTPEIPENSKNQQNSTDSGCINEDSIIYDNSTHIHNDFLKLSNIYNKTVTFEKNNHKKGQKSNKKSVNGGVGVEVHLSNKKSKQLRKNKKSKKHTEDLSLLDDADSSYKAERKRVHEIVSSIIAQQTQQLRNDTILFYTNLDDYTPQFLRIPSQPKNEQKPKMSFYVSAPFEGQATVLNNSYIIKDTIIMRIDCEVFHTEYIGYGSQPTNKNETGENNFNDQPNLSQNSTKL